MGETLTPFPESPVTLSLPCVLPSWFSGILPQLQWSLEEVEYAEGGKLSEEGTESIQLWKVVTRAGVRPCQ